MLPEITEKISKKDIQQLASRIIDKVCLNGNIIELAECISKMDYLIKEIKDNDNYRDYIINEISKYGKSHTTASGTKIELAEVGTKYDYGQTGDVIIVDLELQKAILDAKIKERQTFLKSITKPMEVLFSDEVVTLYPPAKTSTSSVKITISK
jgi:hypothetical protein